MDPERALRVASVAAFAVTLALKIRAQRRRGIQPIRIGGPGWKRAEPVEVAALFGLIGAIGLDGLAPGLLGTAVFDSPAPRIAGSLLLVLAPLTFALAFLHMGRSWRIGIDEDAREELVTHGLFAWSRNPIFLALDLLALGAALQTGKPLFLVGAVLVMVGVHVQILREEAFLRTALGEPYRAYCSAVQRYFGRR